MKYTIKQESEKGCGVACIKMMLAYFNKDESFLDLNIETSINDFNKMKQTLSSYSLETEGVNITDETYLDQLHFCICQIKEREYHHFVIFIKKKKNKIYLFDPKIGERILTRQEFLNISTGNYLIYKDMKPYKMKEKEPKYYQIPYFITYGISCLIDFFFIYMFTFLDNSLLHISLVVAGIFINFILKVIIVFAYDKYLETILLTPLYEKDSNLVLLEPNLKLKSHLVEYYFKTIAFIFIALFLVILLIEDSFYNLILILVSFIFLIIRYSLIKYIDIRIKEEILQKERDIVSIDECTYKSLKKSSLKEVIVLLTFFLTFALFNIFGGLFINILIDSHSFTHLMFIILTNVSLFEFINKIIEINTKNQEKIHLLKSSIKPHLKNEKSKK